MERIRTWDLRTQTRDSKGSSRKEAFGQLERLRQKLGLPGSVVEKAAYIYRKVQRKKKIRMSRTRIGAMAACVYIACREASIPRTFNEIAEASNVKRKEMWYAYRTIVLDLDLKVPSVDPIGCLVKLANKTGVSEKTKRLGVDYMRKVIHINAAGGKDPMGLAATVLYIASQSHGDRNKSQRYFADIAGVSYVTIKNRIQELRMKIPGLFTHLWRRKKSLNIEFLTLNIIDTMLSEKDVKKYLSDLGSDWELKEGKVVGSFQLSSFMGAIDFVNKIAKVAEELIQSHPSTACLHQ